MVNPLIPKKYDSNKRFIDLPKSKGILDDHAVRKTLNTLEIHDINIILSVVHGATAGTARPTKTDGIVLWIGSVEPTNAENNDLWVDTS